MLDLVAIRVQGVAHQFCDISFTEFVFLAAGLNTGEIQNIVYERRQTLALFTNDAVVLLLLFLGRDTSELECFRIQTDQSQGSAQLMRYVRNEVGFQAGQRHFFADHVFCQDQAAEH